MAWEGMLIFVSDNTGPGHVSSCLPATDPRVFGTHTQGPPNPEHHRSHGLSPDLSGSFQGTEGNSKDLGE